MQQERGITDSTIVLIRENHEHTVDELCHPETFDM